MQLVSSSIKDSLNLQHLKKNKVGTFPVDKMNELNSLLGSIFIIKSEFLKLNQKNLVAEHIHGFTAIFRYKKNKITFLFLSVCGTCN